MSRDVTSLFIEDLSAFARALRSGLETAGAEPSALPAHSVMLGLIAKAAGARNYQHLKAAQPALPAGSNDVKRALRCFDADGVMTLWPAPTKIQALCLWVFWARLPSKVDLTEKQVNAILKSGSSFGDHVLMRRSLIDHRLVSRASDGSAYQRIEQVPPLDALTLIRSLPQPKQVA